jgi:dTDP-4-dehydrorhamnose 3,5-epimerase
LIGFVKELVQINQSINKKKSTLRGLHYQLPPFSEIKLVRYIVRELFNVVVDLRSDSDTFLDCFSNILSEKNLKMLYIPESFAHGFVTLTDNAQLFYQHSEFYKPEFEAGLNFMDASLNIKFPIQPKIMSDKDKNYPFIKNDFKGFAK